MIAGILAVKLATYVVTTLWRLVTREDPPQIDMDVAPGKKAMDRSRRGVGGCPTDGPRQDQAADRRRPSPFSSCLTPPATLSAKRGPCGPHHTQ